MLLSGKQQQFVFSSVVALLQFDAHAVPMSMMTYDLLYGIKT